MCFATVTIVRDSKTPSMVSQATSPALRRRKRVSANYFHAWMVRVLWALSGVFLAIGASTVAQAAPFAYSEAISGDLPSGEQLRSLGAPVFNLEAGVNTISGNLSERAGEGFDSFAFVIPQGFQLSTIQVSYSNSVNFHFAQVNLFRGVGVLWGDPNDVELATDALNILKPSPHALFATTTPLGAGTYSIGNFNLSYASSDPKLYVDYTYILNVQKIAAHTQVPLRPQLDALKSVLGAIFPPVAIVRKSAVVLVHGWNSSPLAWSQQMAGQIRGIIDSRKRQGFFPNEQWDVFYVDWSASSGNSLCDATGIPGCISAPDALANAQGAGKQLADQLRAAQYDHIHFVAHSAGSNLIHFAASSLRSATPLPAKSPVIHSTFLDAYALPGSTPLYGESTNFAEHYVTKEVIPVTAFNLKNAFNFFVDALNVPPQFCDSNFGEVCSHRWPYQLYGLTVRHPLDWSFGIRFATEYSTVDLPTMADFPGGTTCPLLTKLGGCPGVIRTNLRPTVIDVPVSYPWSLAKGTNFVKSATGNVSISTLDAITLTPGSPVWVSLDGNVTEGFNNLQFDYRFTSPAEGLLSVFIDDQVVFKGDQRNAVAGVNHSGRISVGSVAPGRHTLALRLDNFSDAQTSVEVTQLTPSNVSIQQVVNLQPVAHAGQKLKVRLGSKVTLDGSRSFDPDSKPLPLVYRWTQTSGPTVLLFDAATARPTFTSAAKGRYVFSLLVGDGHSNSTASTVKVIASKNGDLDDDDVDEPMCVICNPFSR